MTFWELLSLVRSNQKNLEALLRDEKWRTYLEWYHLRDELPYFAAHAAKRDAILPEDLAIAAMKICTLRFKQRVGLLHCLGDQAPTADSMSALEAYQRFGATLIEDAAERGCSDIPEADVRPKVR